MKKLQLPAPEAVRVVPLDDMKVHVFFKDKTDGIVDMKKLCRNGFNGVLAQLLDPAYFAKVRVHPHGVLEWPGEVDFCADVVYAYAHGLEHELFEEGN